MTRSASCQPSILRKKRRTNCRLCSYLCGLIAVVEQDRIISLEPDPSRYPYQASLVRGCRRFRSNLEFLDHPQRLNVPLKRTAQRGSNQWQQLSWDQALDEIAEKLDRLRGTFGPETLATAIGGPHTTFWPLHRFMNLFGSPNNMGIGQICWNPSIWVNSLTFGWPLENEIDPHQTRCVILWGVNPAQSDNSLFWGSVRDYSHGKWPLVVIDPRRTGTAVKADFWLAPRPGTDAALALGFLHVLIRDMSYDKDFVDRWCHGFAELRAHVAAYSPERVSTITGIPAIDIETVAHLYAKAQPACIFHGRGIDQIGANSMQVHRAIACLKAITGNVDRPGACHLTEAPDYLAEIDLELTDRLPEGQRLKQLGRETLQLQTYAGYERLTRETIKHGKRLPARYLTSAQPNLVWRAMLESKPYPIRALAVSGSNPLLCQADAGLIYKAMKSLDLLVVLDLFPNPVTALADYLLPIAGSLERPVLQTNAGIANLAYGGPNAVAPRHERRCDFDVWRALGIRLGQQQDWPWQTFEESLTAIVAPLGLSWEEFCQEGLYFPEPVYQKFAQERAGEKLGFATPSGKIELYSQLLKEVGAAPLPEHCQISSNSIDFPLSLITGGRKQPYWASSFRQLETLKPANQEAEVEISPETARQLGLVAGQKLRVETRHGGAFFTLRLKPMRTGVVHIDYGCWFPHEDLSEPHLGGMFSSNANLLTSADFSTCDPLLGQWQYNAIPCRILPAEIDKSTHLTLTSAPDTIKEVFHEQP